MSIPTDDSPRTVALIGNPNTGKSTLFSALAGIHQHIGNYPGVTVEKKTGQMEYDGHRYKFVDLPGLYSLAPRSRDEMIAVELLLGRRKDMPPVDAVLCIANASNLQRNLYLVSQVLELGLPTVLAVNMLDVADDHGIAIDVERLGTQLPISVVAIQANRRIGINRLKAVLSEAVDRGPHQEESPFPEPFENEVTQLQNKLAELSGADAETQPLPRCLLRRLLLDMSGYLEEALFPRADGRIRTELEAARSRLADVDCAVPRVETTARYDWVHGALEGVVTQPALYQTTVSDRIDRVLTHRLWGTLIFAVLMVIVFQSVFSWAEPLMGLIVVASEAVGGWIEVHLAEGMLRSLLVDGVIAGVGGILAFLPQILILFLFIAVLEDCGYMARAAFLMDKMMVRVGLSGKSFIPMLSSFACAIPGIMAARVIENERDRLTTILVAPLMTCSARLPVYALLIAAFIPARSYLGGLLNLQGLTLMALYLLGISTAVVAALVLKRTILRGQAPPFLLEMPSYKWPSPRTVLMRVVQRGWLFVKCAGTLILAVSILVWAALYFPHGDAPFDDPTAAAQQQQQSVLGRLGRIIEPAVKPLGWDWRIGCAVLASFPARELVVATMGVIYNVGEDVDLESTEGATQLQAKLRSATWDGTDRPVFNLPVALSILVFYALCAQCAATLAVIRRETNSWRWPAFTFGYMTMLAYLGALITYQLGMWIGAQ